MILCFLFITFFFFYCSIAAGHVKPEHTLCICMHTTCNTQHTLRAYYTHIYHYYYYTSVYITPISLVFYRWHVTCSFGRSDKRARVHISWPLYRCASLSPCWGYPSETPPPPPPPMSSCSAHNTAALAAVLPITWKKSNMYYFLYCRGKEEKKSNKHFPRPYRARPGDFTRDAKIRVLRPVTAHACTLQRCSDDTLTHAWYLRYVSIKSYFFILNLWNVCMCILMQCRVRSRERGINIFLPRVCYKIIWHVKKIQFKIEFVWKKLVIEIL